MNTTEPILLLYRHIVGGTVIRRMTSFVCMLLLILNLGLLGSTDGGSIAESIQQLADLSKLPQNSFCPGEVASLT
jgi:hypothetical protein